MPKVNYVIKIAIFASGNGSNAEEIIKYFKNSKLITVELVMTNNAKAYVLQRANNNNISSYTFNRSDFYNSDDVLNKLEKHKIDFIVLAGFLWLIPKNLIERYHNKIINIHPALLPSYGGKGMYGSKVHEAVHFAKEKETGITIHFVNEHYDRGDIIFQAKCTVNEEDTPELIQQKVHLLEHKYFPAIIEKTIMKTFEI